MEYLIDSLHLKNAYQEEKSNKQTSEMSLFISILKILPSNVIPIMRVSK